MQSQQWIGLFRRIPASQHDSLLLMTSTGGEIVLQRIIRLERDFLIAVGRVSGSTDDAKLVAIPYSQLTYLTFNKKMKDEEIAVALLKPSGKATVVEAP